MKTYDALFILPTNLDQPGTDKVLESIKAEIERQGGTHVESDVMGRRSFARGLGKSHEGHYIRMRIEMAPENVSKFSNRLKLNEQIFRFQILVSDLGPLKKVRAPLEEDGSSSKAGLAAAAVENSDG